MRRWPSWVVISRDWYIGGLWLVHGKGVLVGKGAREGE